MILQMKNYFLCAFFWTKIEFKTLLMAQQSGWAMIGFLASRCREIQKFSLNSSPIKWRGQMMGLWAAFFSCYPAIPGMHSFVTCPATMSHQRLTLLEKSVFPEDVKLITERSSGHSFQCFMRSFYSKRSLACHAVKCWI